MIESEARTKWCPFARSRSIQYRQSNNVMGCTTYMLNGHDVPTTTCIGSACMAWRWINLDVKDFGAVGDYNQKTGEGTDDTEAFQKAIDAATERHGYCGLAGKL